MTALLKHPARQIPTAATRPRPLKRPALATWTMGVGLLRGRATAVGVGLLNRRAAAVGVGLVNRRAAAVGVGLVHRRAAAVGSAAARLDCPVLIGPNWFASVMGTGIVATAAATLPLRVPGLRTLATVVWAVAAILLVVLAAAAVRHRAGYRGDVVAEQFWGAPPMAMMTVGAGALLLGRDWLGESVAVAVDVVLWTGGTLLGLAVAVLIPYRMLTRHRPGPETAFGGRLMPVVSPMVSAATGALLVPHVPAPRALLVACYVLAGVSLGAAVLVLGQLWRRLARYGPGAARMVPTWWIVLGPIGQSVTAAHLLGRAADGVLSEPYARAAQELAVLYGVPVLGLALAWAGVAAAITVRAARAGLPFSLAWWSFTFPVGTVVTGASGLAERTGAALPAALAVALYATLLAAWSVVAVRTLSGARRGDLLRPAPPARGAGLAAAP